MATQSLSTFPVLSCTMYLEYTIAGFFWAPCPIAIQGNISFFDNRRRSGSPPPLVVLSPSLTSALVIISHESY